MRTIAWDVDDVLNDLMRTWLEAVWKPRHPECRMAYEELVANPPHQVLQLPLTDYLASLDAFRLSEGFAHLVPRPDVMAWFRKHGRNYHHVALTAVPLRCAPASASWVLRHFGCWIRSFHVIPSPRRGEELPPYDCSKAEFLRRDGRVAVFIDDNAEQVAASNTLAIRAVLFPRPWNQATNDVAAALDQLLEP